MSEHGEKRSGPGAPGRFDDLRLLAGRMAGVMGIVLAVAGVFGPDISFEAMGIIFGTTGYMLGSRVLGVAAIVLSTVMLVVVLMVARGYLPGIGPTYPGLF